MKNYKIGKFVLFVSLAISIIFLTETYLENLQYFIGGLITLYGIDKAVMFFDVEKHEKPKVLCESIVQVILGVCTIILFKELSTICVIWAVWSIMRESEEIAECYEHFKEKLPWILSFAESVVAIVFSIMLIMEQSHFPIIMGIVEDV